MSDSNNSSTEGEEVPQLKISDPRCLSLHVIADPGQSESINTSFQYMIGRLNPSLDVLSVSERFKSHKGKENSVEIKDDLDALSIPSLAIVLFFKEDFNFEKPFENENQQSDLYQIRKILSQKPWRFHHKVEVSGKLISCDSNQQDFYYYSHDCIHRKENNNASDANSSIHFPLWAVRKVHYGKQILRFLLFVDAKNWKNQINFYKLILRKEEATVREDFCYFNTFENDSIIIQLALKRLPSSIQPQPVLSSILQFKVKNVGQLVPLLPNSCEPISELRWRTRDHDSNLILLQIRRTRDLNAGASFVKKMFEDQQSCEKSKATKRRAKRSKGRAGAAKPKSSTPKTKTPFSDESLLLHSVEDFSNENSQPPEAMLLKISENFDRLGKHQTQIDQSTTQEIANKDVNFDLDYAQCEKSNTHENKKPNTDSKQHFAIKGTKKFRNFEIEKKGIVENQNSLPTKNATCAEHTVYFQTNYSRHSPRSSSGSSRSTTGTSDYHTTRETSPESHSSGTKIKIASTKEGRTFYVTKNNCSSAAPTKSAKDCETTTSAKCLPLALTKDEGFYV